MAFHRPLGFCLLWSLAAMPLGRAETHLVRKSSSDAVVTVHIGHGTLENHQERIVAGPGPINLQVEIFKLTSEPEITYGEVRVSAVGFGGKRMTVLQLTPRLINYTEFQGAGSSTAVGFYKWPQGLGISSIQVRWHGSTVSVPVASKAIGKKVETQH